MSTKVPHIVRTALQNRQKMIMAARISRVESLSSTVKGLELSVDGERCEFKAGQWLDLFVPGISHIGGFSMCSPPNEFSRCGTLQLAIKFSEDPVAKWVHEKCRHGDQVQFRFGGDFYYDPAADANRSRSICLIAGGVGVNPLISILQETFDFDARQGNERRIVLLQAAKREEELLFEDKTKAFSRLHAQFCRSLFLTESSADTNHDGIKSRRIGQTDLQLTIDQCGSDANYFICGPSSMIDDISQNLIDLGVLRENIFFEKWS